MCRPHRHFYCRGLKLSCNLQPTDGNDEGVSRDNTQDQSTDSASYDDDQGLEVFVRGECGPDATAEFDIHTLPFHQYCAGLGRGEWYVSEARKTGIKLHPGSWIRILGRRWPLLILVLGFGSVTLAEWSSAISGISAFVGNVTSGQFLFGLLLVGLWSGVIFLVDYGHVIERNALWKPLLVYGLVGLFGLGTATNVVRVFLASDPTTLEDNVVFASGLFLAMLVAGMVVYDTLIRTENMLANLGRKAILENKAGYQAFKRELEVKLTQRLFGTPIHVSTAFSVLFVAQFGVFWWIGDGPHGMGSLTLLVVNVLLDFLLMIGVYQFALVLSEFRPLLGRGYESERGLVRLQYRPFHSDGRGGFRDLGRAAMRVNGLIIIAGLFYGYRIFVQGSRSLTAAIVADPLSTPALLWGFNYVFPILVYGVVAAGWLYFTFWQLHVKMVKQREELILERQRALRMDAKKTDKPLGHHEDAEFWRDLGNAPVWPVDNRQLTTLVTANAIPLFLTFSSFPI